MRYLLITLLLLFTGCVGNNLSFRGVINTYDTEATMEGKATVKPVTGDTAINAEKSTTIDTDADVDTK